MALCSLGKQASHQQGKPYRNPAPTGRCTGQPPSNGHALKPTRGATSLAGAGGLQEGQGAAREARQGLGHGRQDELDEDLRACGQAFRERSQAELGRCPCGGLPVIATRLGPASPESRGPAPTPARWPAMPHGGHTQRVGLLALRRRGRLEPARRRADQAAREELPAAVPPEVLVRGPPPPRPDHCPILNAPAPGGRCLDMPRAGWHWPGHASTWPTTSTSRGKPPAGCATRQGRHASAKTNVPGRPRVLGPGPGLAELRQDPVLHLLHRGPLPELVWQATWQILPATHHPGVQDCGARVGQDALIAAWEVAAGRWAGLRYIAQPWKRGCNGHGVEGQWHRHVMAAGICGLLWHRLPLVQGRQAGHVPTLRGRGVGAGGTVASSTQTRDRAANQGSLATARPSRPAPAPPTIPQRVRPPPCGADGKSLRTMLGHGVQ